MRATAPVTAQDTLPDTPDRLLAASVASLAASEEAFLQGDQGAAAPLAFQALRWALQSAMARHSLPCSERGSLLAQAEQLARTARLDCLSTRIAPLLPLGLDPRDLPQDPVRLSRLLSSAHEITKNLQALASAAPSAPAGGRC